MIVLAFFVIAGLAYWLLTRLHWSRPWKLAAMLGIAIVAAALGPYGYLRAAGDDSVKLPSSDPVVGRTVDIKPNVAGAVLALPVQPGTFVKKGSIVLQIDRAPFEATIRGTELGLTQTRQKIVQLKAGVAQASAAVETAQSQYNNAVWRLNDLQKLPAASQPAFK